MGEDLLNLDRAGEAEGLLRRAVVVLKKTQVAGSKETAIAETSLGECLVALRRFSEAEPLLLESYAVLSTDYGGSQYARDSLDALGSLYESWGKPEQAKEWRAKLEAQNAAAQSPK